MQSLTTKIHKLLSFSHKEKAKKKGQMVTRLANSQYHGERLCQVSGDVCQISDRFLGRQKMFIFSVLKTHLLIGTKRRLNMAQEL